MAAREYQGWIHQEKDIFAENGICSKRIVEEKMKLMSLSLSHAIRRSVHLMSIVIRAIVTFIGSASGGPVSEDQSTAGREGEQRGYNLVDTRSAEHDFWLFA